MSSAIRTSSSAIRFWRALKSGVGQRVAALPLIGIQRMIKTIFR